MEKQIVAESVVTQPMLDNVRRNALAGISEKRCAHILGVEKEALFMAKAFFPLLGIPPECEADVSCMALLHDFTKEMPMNAQIELCKNAGFELSEHDFASPAVIHSISGAATAKTMFKMPVRITNAILKHTTGGQSMTLWDKILFVADFTEPGRKFDSCKSVRDVLHNGVTRLETPKEALLLLDKCTCLAALETVKHIAEKGEKIHPGTISTLKSICKSNSTPPDDGFFKAALNTVGKLNT